MPTRLRVLLALPVVIVATALARLPAAGGDASTSLPDAVKRGEELWKKPMAAAGKACNDCHAGGQNALTVKRAQTYPKFDKALNKVVTLQQKLNQMIVEKGRGTALELGSTDLNALEAYIATRK